MDALLTTRRFALLQNSGNHCLFLEDDLAQRRDSDPLDDTPLPNILKNRSSFLQIMKTFATIFVVLSLGLGIYCAHRSLPLYFPVWLHLSHDLHAERNSSTGELCSMEQGQFEVPCSSTSPSVLQQSESEESSYEFST
jgi:hypothetical protein